ncbi:MAG: hypothetical protein KZQ70_10725 [gamma proteobacterium symbiont of Lucinoma myriamae]|nr:hypothetical protein [gamma proteobacterium symbiont of Lucinoma myriamae]
MNTSEQFVDSHKVTEKKAELLYLQAPISNSAVILIALLCFFFLNEYAQLSALIVWTLMLLIIACYRLFL